jgi:effector-binding domain-containing protein
MSRTPEVIERAEEPYVAIRTTVTMASIGAASAHFPAVFEWLARHGSAPAGPPFFKYDVIDMASQLQIEVGVPVPEHLADDGSVLAGVLPAGRYASVIHVGHPGQLADTTADLLAWAESNGLAFDTTATSEGERWACRLENYLTDPAEQPDMTKWETQLAFLLAS